MPEGLKIQVGADVQQAVKALSQDVPKAADKAADSFQQLGKTISSSTSNAFSKQIPAAANTANNAIKNLAATIKRDGANSFTVLGESGQLAGSKLRSLSGVLQTTATTIPTLTAATNNSTGSFLKFAAAFGLGNLAGNLLIGVLDGLNTAIFGSKKLFSEAELAAGEFGNTLRGIRNDVDELKKSLSFQAEINKLKLELSGLSGNQLSIAGGVSDISFNAQGAVALDGKIKQLIATQKTFLSDIEKTNAQVRKFSGGSTELDKLIKRFGSIENIPQEFVKAIDEQGTSLVTSYRQANAEIKKLQSDRNNFLNSNVKEFLGIGISFNNEVKKQQEELAKKLKPKISPNIKKQIESELRPLLGSIQIELPTIFDTESADARSRFGKQLDDLERNIQNTGKPIVLPVRINLSQDAISNNQIVADLRKQQEAIAQIFGISTQESPLTRIQKEAVFAAQAINDVLQPAFKGLFDAILAGENPLKAFFTGLGNAVAQLVQKLISAAITAAILSAIFPAGVGGAKGFGSIFGKILGFAAGGLVTGPQLALIGEGSGTSRANPEVVAPLDKLKGMLAGMGGGSQVVVMRTIVRGNNLALVQARTSRSQKRTTGR